MKPLDVRYGRWTVIDPTGRKVGCRCDCGTERRVDRYTLLDGRSISCGCHMDEVRRSPEWSAARTKHVLSAGDRFGRLLVLDASDRAAVRVRCDCGTEKNARAGDLVTGDSTSCGCWKLEASRDRAASAVGPFYRHGYAHHPLYRIWQGMMSRCADPGDGDFARYGGRGITVYEPWHDLATYIRDIEAWLGPRVGNATIDRIDNDGDYRPGNVRWATRAEQARNRHAPGDAVTAVRDAAPDWSRRDRRKVTADEVDAIRALAREKTPQVEIARRFGISQPHVSRLVRE